jgi:hypothetical protein
LWGNDRKAFFARSVGFPDGSAYLKGEHETHAQLLDECNLVDPASVFWKISLPVNALRIGHFSVLAALLLGGCATRRSVSVSLGNAGVAAGTDVNAFIAVNLSLG